MEKLNNTHGSTGSRMATVTPLSFKPRHESEGEATSGGGQTRIKVWHNSAVLTKL